MEIWEKIPYLFFMNYDVIIVASGKGERAKLGYNKAFFRMKDGMSVLEHTLSLFLEDEDCRNIIVVTSEGYMKDVPDHQKLICVIGGKERKDSVANGLRFATSEYVLIHDAVRPYLRKETLEELKKKTEECGAVCLGHMACDTVKLVKDKTIVRTIDRNEVFLAETPQAFRTRQIQDAYDRRKDSFFTDDASLMESLGHEVHILIDEYDNPKLTKEEDFIGI